MGKLRQQQRQQDFTWGLLQLSLLTEHLPRVTLGRRSQTPGLGCSHGSLCICSRWEEEKKEDGVKWTQLEHRGPYFVPLYEPLPDDVQFYYDGKSALRWDLDHVEFSAWLKSRHLLLCAGGSIATHKFLKGLNIPLDKA